MKTSISKTALFIALAGAMCLATSTKTHAFEAKINAVLSELSTARMHYADAQESLGKALGIKDEYLKKLSEAKAAVSGATNEKQKTKAEELLSKATAAAEAESAKAMLEGKELSAEAKTWLADGAAKFAKGLATQIPQVKAVKSIVEKGNAQISAASALQKAKLAKALKPATALASSLPGDVKKTGETGKMILDYATKKNIEAPGLKEATAGLGDL
jgi:hypothetical protein